MTRSSYIQLVNIQISRHEIVTLENIIYHWLFRNGDVCNRTELINSIGDINPDYSELNKGILNDLRSAYGLITFKNY